MLSINNFSSTDPNLKFSSENPLNEEVQSPAYSAPRSLLREISRINADFHKMTRARLSETAQAGINLYLNALEKAPEKPKADPSLSLRERSRLLEITGRREEVIDLINKVKNGEVKDPELIKDFEDLGKRYAIPENAFAHLQDDEEALKELNKKSPLSERIISHIRTNIPEKEQFLNGLLSVLAGSKALDYLGANLKDKFHEFAAEMPDAERKAINESVVNALHSGVGILEAISSNTSVKQFVDKTYPEIKRDLASLKLIAKIRFGEITDEDLDVVYENGKNLLHKLIEQDDPARLKKALKVSTKSMNAKDAYGNSVLDHAFDKMREAKQSHEKLGTEISEEKLKRAQGILNELIKTAIKADTKLDFKESLDNLYEYALSNEKENLFEFGLAVNMDRAEITDPIFIKTADDIYAEALKERDSEQFKKAIFKGLDLTSLTKPRDKAFIEALVKADDSVSIINLVKVDKSLDRDKFLKLAVDNNADELSLGLISLGTDAKKYYPLFKDTEEKTKLAIRDAILKQIDSSSKGRLKWALRNSENELVPDQLRKYDFKNLAQESIHKMIEASLGIEPKPISFKVGDKSVSITAANALKANPEGFKLILNKLDKELVNDVKDTEREDLFKEKYLRVLEAAHGSTEKNTTSPKTQKILQLINEKLEELNTQEPEEEIIPVVEAEVIPEITSLLEPIQTSNSKELLDQINQGNNNQATRRTEVEPDLLQVLLQGGLYIASTMIEGLLEASRRIAEEQARQERIEAEKKRQALEEAKRKQEEFNAKVKENTPKVLKGLGIAAAVGGTIWGGNELVTHHQYKNTDYAGMTHEQRETARPNFELHDAIKLRDPNLVKNTYEKNSYKINLNYENPRGYNAFHIAVETGVLDTVKFLLDKDSDLINRTNSKNGLTPLHIAALAGNEEVFSYLLEKGADLKQTDNNGKMARDYLEEKLEKKKELKSSLLREIESGSLQSVQNLLNAGADIKTEDKRGRTLLHMLAQNKNNESRQIYEYLINKGLDIEARDRLGQTPLHHAAFYGNFDGVKILIKHNADVNARSHEGETPLDYAARYDKGKSKFSIIKTLKEAGGEKFR